MYGQSLQTGVQLGRSFMCKLMVQNRVLREVPPCVTDKGHMSLHAFAVMPLFRKTQIEGPFEGSTLQNARCKPSCLNPKDRRPNRISDPRPCPIGRLKQRNLFLLTYGGAGAYWPLP